VHDVTAKRHADAYADRIPNFAQYDRPMQDFLAMAVQREDAHAEARMARRALAIAVDEKAAVVAAGAALIAHLRSMHVEDYATNAQLATFDDLCDAWDEAAR
jgi:hypothetical protein